MSYPNEAVDREIFIEVRPVDSVPGWGDLQARPLLRGRLCESPRVPPNINLVVLSVYPQAQDGADKGYPLNIVL